MARTVQQILTEIQNYRLAQPGLAPLNSPSQVAIYNLLEFIQAQEINQEEINWDNFQLELEAIIAAAPVGTDQWLRQMVLNFQYDALNPQIIQIVNFAVGYNPVDATKRIITRASVITAPNSLVSIKVAKQEPPIALSSTEIASLKGMLSQIVFAGTQYNVVSLNSDKLYCGCNVYYNGQYSAVIQASVEAGINAFLAAIPFNGILKLSSLETSILNVTGVNDVVFTNVATRADTSTQYLYLVQNSTELQNQDGLFAGYIIPETNSGSTLADTITYSPQ